MNGFTDLFTKTEQEMMKSPSEDFLTNTLAAIPGTLGKLRYVAGLRQDNGEYFHWGMARIHGEANASTAIADAHSDLFIEILRTPMSTLLQEVETVSDREGANPTQVVRGLLDSTDRLVPSQKRGGSVRHFSSVLAGLVCLSRS